MAFSRAAPLLIASLFLCLLAFMPCVDAARDGWKVTGKSKKEAKEAAKAFKAVDGNDQMSKREVAEWFNDWKATYGKTYADRKSEARAFNSFKAALKRAAADAEDDSKPWWSGPNHFSDMSFEEFKATVLMRTVPDAPASTEAVPQSRHSTPGRKLLQTAPAKSFVDWRSASTPIKDQGRCGGCWAFAATAAVESAYIIARGNYTGLNLSEQQLLNCVNAANGYYSQGCYGGSSSDALKYIFVANQTTEARWPYTSQTGSVGACSASLLASPAGQAVKSARPYTLVPLRNEVALMNAVAVQPVIAYMSVQASFYTYTGGIYKGTDCAQPVNHAVLIVGYNYTGNPATSYFLVRNSWSTWWGERGYVRMAMTGNGNGLCGLYTYLMAPSLSFTAALRAASG